MNCELTTVNNEHHALLRANILDTQRFVRATFSGVQHGAELRWKKLAIRPVELKNGRHLQFSYFDAAQDITKNFAGMALEQALDEVLALPFRNIQVQMTDEDIVVQFSKKGKHLVSRKPTAEARAVNLAHDRDKPLPIPLDAATRPFLRAVGIVTAEGKIKADMHHKYQQINDFLRLVGDELVAVAAHARAQGRPVLAVDFGCGNAHLTFALYYHLTQTLGAPASITGIDLKAHLIARHNTNAAALGWDRLTFVHGAILDYGTDTPPDVVIALHACDTATDDALAQGMHWGSRLIVAAPCCHHNLQDRLEHAQTPAPFAPVLRYGILGERVGDVLTETFRALLLRQAGYRVDVVEFVDAEHTPKNIMIRAVKTGNGDPRAAEEYTQLAAFWGVTPYLAELVQPT